MIKDIHTHKQPPAPEAIIACEPQDLPTPEAFPGQLYSVGIHPWSITAMGLSPAQRAELEAAARRDDVVAIGESGIDLVRKDATPLFAQMLAFKAHVEISEAIGKPMIIHCVKAYNEIIGIKKDMQPRQRWIVHGFRGKPAVLEMLLRAGIDVSYGEKFNPESVAQTPADRMHAETDTSPRPIEEIIAALDAARRITL